MVCSLCRKYRPPTTSGTFDDDIAITLKMTMLAKKTNEPQQFVPENGMLNKCMFNFFCLLLIYVYVYILLINMYVRFENRC